MRSFIRRTTTAALTVAACLALGTAASACESSSTALTGPSPTQTNTPSTTPTPETVSYIVTDDEGTSVDLDITYQDNLDYENDHPQYCTNHRILAYMFHNTAYHYTWTECTGVPINERPRTPEYS